MRILSLELTNFMNITHADLHFSPGKNILNGENGQGKSSVLEAIAYCCVGRTRGSSWKDYVRLGEDSFKIHLEMLKTNSEEDKLVFDYIGDAGGGSVSKTVRYHGQTYIGEKANEFLSSIFDIKMLENTVFSMQDGVAVSKLPPAELRETLKKLFNTDFPLAVEEIQKDLEALKSKESLISATIELIKGKKYNYYTDEGLKEPDVERLKELRSLMEIVQAVEIAQQKYNTYRSKVQSLIALQSRRVSLEERRDKAIQSGDMISKTEEPIQQLRTTLQAQIGAQKEVIIGINNQIISKKREILVAEQKEATSTWDAESKVIEETISGMQASAIVLERHIKAHENGKGVCENCGQTTDASDVPLMKTDLADLIVLIETEKQRLAKVRQAKKDYQFIISGLKAELSELQNTLVKAESTLAGIENQLKIRDKEIQAVAVAVESSMTRVKEILVDLGAIVEEINEVSMECDRIKVEEPDINSGISYDQVNAEIQSWLSGVEKVKLRKKSNEDLKLSEAEDKKELALKVEDLNLVQLDIKGQKELVKVFNDLFPNYVNIRACTILQDRMNDFFEGIKNKFLVLLQQSKKGIDILYRAEDSPHWGNSKMASGMETALLSLGFKIAVAEAYGNDMILLDEPDASCDEESSERLFKAITAIDNFQQMFIITHSPEATVFLKESGARVYTVQAGVFSLAG